jgi:hypothetical protein
MFKARIPGHMWLGINYRSARLKVAEVTLVDYPDIASGPYLPSMDMEMSKKNHAVDGANLGKNKLYAMHGTKFTTISNFSCHAWHIIESFSYSAVCR